MQVLQVAIKSNGLSLWITEFSHCNLLLKETGEFSAALRRGNAEMEKAEIHLGLILGLHPDCTIVRPLNNNRLIKRL